MFQSSVELLSVNNLPYNCFEWPAFRRVWGACCDALGIIINRENIKTHVRAVVSREVDWLAYEMREKLVSLKADSGMRYNRHRTLAMLEVNESQTAKFLKNKFLDVLKRYKLKLEQILSITTDNGANMLAAAKQLQQQFVMAQSQLENGMIDDEDTTTEDNFNEALMTELTVQHHPFRNSLSAACSE
uniref:DUF659 domain-containing protein n=1 Tax=Anopheles christyi TaxID=43041 RepID=A0A182KHJ4_9DIPT